ncbi:MAG: BNR-4 repeat-containing protein [Pirellulales bacterium]
MMARSALIAMLVAVALATFVHAEEPIALNQKDDGYRGIWYMNQPSGDEYVYKYSGGLGTYCAKHKPFAVYRPEVNKTFFCYGGTTVDSNRRLVHMVSYFDHETKTVPRPTILLDKQTSDAHDNPVISVDADGYVWIFSTSHGTSRPSYIHRSTEPYSVDTFERIDATRQDGDRRVPITNFSYMQAWHSPGRGFLCFFTRYGDPAARTLMCMTSPDGVTWSAWQRLAAIEEGHYQISALGSSIAGTALNYHPQGQGLNWRTNLYYLQTPDFGRTWHAVDGRPLEVPLTDVVNAALVHDYRDEGLNVYLKDIRFDDRDRPIILYLTSKGYESGPKNDPRTWTTARWTGSRWDIRPVCRSDNNYDMGSLWLDADGTWRIIGPTESGPQPYNPGGEVAMWTSTDQGRSWEPKTLTADSQRNHTYIRRPIDAHDDFYAFWADGHGRQPSLSRLYIADRQGNVWRLPREMSGETAPLEPVPLMKASP